MMSKERRLGRGLEALLGQLNDSPAAPAAAGSPSALPQGYGPGNAALPTPAPSGRLPVSAIDKNPFQPRQSFDEADLAVLAASMKTHGLLQPVVVRRSGERFQLVAGERRLRAAVLAGWSEVPARVVEADDRQMAELAIVENLQRRDLNPLEKGLSFQNYIERFRCTQEQLAARLLIDRTTVTNLMRLLELPARVREAIQTGAISQGHARALLPLGDEQEQVAVCQRIQEERLSVRQTEELVQTMIAADDAAPAPEQPAQPRIRTPQAAARRAKLRTRSDHLASLEQDLRRALGTKVDIRPGANDRGKIVIHFRSNAEFERLAELLGGETQPPSRKAG